MHTLEQIMNHVYEQQILSTDYRWKPLLGGTNSTVAQVSATNKPSYIIKTNSADVIQKETQFLTLYGAKSILFPVLYYADPMNRFYIYSFFPGSTTYEAGNKTAMLCHLVDKYINLYQKLEHFDHLEWCYDPKTMEDSLHYAKERIGSHLSDEDFDFVFEFLKKPYQQNRKPSSFLLHGDCGVHNFIFQHGQLSGVIDPSPTVGEPIFDLFYAFCSSPDDLTLNALLPAVGLLKINPLPSSSILLEEVLIALYCRLGTCIDHHPHDLSQYLKAWHQLKQQML